MRADSDSPSPTTMRFDGFSSVINNSHHPGTPEKRATGDKLFDGLLMAEAATQEWLDQGWKPRYFRSLRWLL